MNFYCSITKLCLGAEDDSFCGWRDKPAALPASAEAPISSQIVEDSSMSTDSASVPHSSSTAVKDDLVSAKDPETAIPMGALSDDTNEEDITAVTIGLCLPPQGDNSWWAVYQRMQGCFKEAGIGNLAATAFGAEHTSKHTVRVHNAEVRVATCDMTAIQVHYHFPESCGVSYEHACWLLADPSAPQDRFPYEWTWRKPKVLSRKEGSEPSAMKYTILYDIPVRVPYVSDRQGLVDIYTWRYEDVFVSLSASIKNNWRASINSDAVRVQVHYELFAIKRSHLGGLDALTSADVEYGGLLPPVFMERLQLKAPTEWYDAVISRSQQTMDKFK